MDKTALKRSVVMGAAGLVLMSTAQAGIPVWTFSPLSGYPPVLDVSITGTAIIKYTVTNQSQKSHLLKMKSIQGVTPSGCTTALAYHESCILTLAVNGSGLKGDLVGGPVLCDHGNPNQCYSPSQADNLDIHLIAAPPGTATLIPSITTLALSINCQPASLCMTTQHPALTGNKRQIIIQNTGSAAATNVSVSSLNLPFGTTISGCTGTLNAGSSCIITLTPGSIANSDANNAPCTSGTEPVASTVTVTADGGLSSQISTYVLGYGCQYQGGFLYSVNDSYADYAATKSIGGKVTSLVDQAEPFLSPGGPQFTSVIWSSNGVGASTVDYSTILGIDEFSTTSMPSPMAPAYPTGTPPYEACDGSTDGACDSKNIVSYYNFNRASGGSPPTPLTFYAAGLCTATINTYSDWYLPAICEMDSVHLDGFCPMGTQSMLESLPFLLGLPSIATPNTSCSPPTGTDCLAGSYWSSTELHDDPDLGANTQLFDSTGASNHGLSNKASRFGVRCSRALTP